MNLDWASIADFKIFGFKGGWKFKHLCSLIQYGTLDDNLSRTPGVYTVVRNRSSAPGFVVKRTSGFYQRKILMLKSAD